MDGRCPSTTQTCLGGDMGECCEDADILSGGTTAAPTQASTQGPTQAPTQGPTQAPTPACVDQVNPLTGVSDCQRLSYLCNDSLYYALMTQQCPLTCNRCNGATQQPAPSSNCRDLVHYQTGVSDCPQRAYLCTNALYRSLMQVQCPRTCGFCT
ncbi:unnamed protein product [Cylicocyclus nassatus]|uniref:ShKT domain-containing protein n=1 Tax=Cylicocyclus nassatus TaxID=53992 RepID=A0AA36DM58_CYLNA|nr:unnamed protein product [Cylicocyclus nassatus]